MNADWLWDRKISLKEIKRILKDDQHDRFVEISALLFSRKNTPREVFGDYIGMERFVKNWPRIKKQMRRNNWNDPRIIYWHAVYKRLTKSYKEKGIPVRAPGVPDNNDELCTRVGNRIKALREKNNLTQKALAERLGISQQIVSRVERGKTNISLLTLKKIANVFNRKVVIELEQQH